MASITERKFICPWCVYQAIDFYCDRKFERTYLPLEFVYGEIPESKETAEGSYESEEAKEADIQRRTSNLDYATVNKILNTDYEEFSTEQIKFWGDTVLIIIY